MNEVNCWSVESMLSKMPDKNEQLNDELSNDLLA